MKLLSLLSIIFIKSISFSQTSVYNCYSVQPVSESEIQATSIYTETCVEFDQQNYNFSQNDNNTIIASKQINISPNFSSHNYTLGNGMSLLICDNLNDVLSFSHSNMADIEALSKFEFGIELPPNIEQRIQDFIDTKDTLNGGINPFLEWQINTVATLTHKATGTIKQIHGFYYQDFERDTNYILTKNYTWNAVPTSHHMRFRFAPEKLGDWNISINITLKDGSEFNYCPFKISVTQNTSDDGYVEVAPNKRMLQRNNELFFPVGQNLPWPDDQTLDIGNYAAWSNKHSGSYPHIEFQKRLEDLKSEGVDYFRIMLNPATLEIEFEDIGNYTDRLNDGWEIDQIIEKAEELDQYIHFNMLLHDNLENKSVYYRYNWDWGQEYIPYGSSSGNYLGSFGYKNKFGLCDTCAIEFFTNEGCKKFFKQKIRYLISRYGYSTHVALFELMSESSNAGKLFNDVYPQGDTTLRPKMVKIYDPYVQDPQHPINVAKWHEEMAQYVKNTLKHNEHILTVSYGRVPNENDYSYGVPEIDIMTYNRYSNWLGNRFNSYRNEVQTLHNQYNKPLMFSETGPIDEYYCAPHATYRKFAWMLSFTGVAGYNMWIGAFAVDDWQYLANVREFIEDTPEVNDLFMGDWETGYFNDNDNINNAYLKEAIYLKGTTQTLQENKMIGVISNLTDNFYTNSDLSDSTSWCVDNEPSFQLQFKQDLHWTNGHLYFPTNTLSDYTFDWFDENSIFHSSTNYPLATVISLTHPLSCVTANCSDETSEIPFIGGWTLSENQRFAKPDSTEISTSIKLSNEIIIYPNPSKNKINIRCNDETIENFVICDNNGKHLLLLKREATDFSINIANLEAGMYVILGMDKTNGVKYQTKWVKL